MDYLENEKEAAKVHSDCETSNSDKSYIEDTDDDEDEDDLNEDDDEITTDRPDKFLDSVDFDYMNDIVKLLENHAEVSTDNALVLNRKLQDMLETLRAKIVSMLEKCREKYVENQAKLANPTSETDLLTGIGSCGAPFFKDCCGRPCPSNSDYVYRSEVKKELFPIDLQLFPHFIWTANDKLGILKGIKEQAIEYIERKEAYPSTSSDKKSEKLRKNVKSHSGKLSDLLDRVDDEFTIDWNQISVYNLKSRHTANSCYAIWDLYLKPEIKRDEWTEEENLKLNELAKEYKFQDWIAVAAELPGRSDYQCFVQYQTVVSVQMREDKGERWTKEEDDLLLRLVEKHRMGNVIRWNPICSQLPNRTKQQCFARYKYSINPNILRAPFTPQEDCVILAAVEEYGENFNCFPKALFPNRTIVQIRNRYQNSIKARENIRFWTPEDDKILLQLVAQYGNRDWRKISDELVRHSRTSCRTRFVVISKFLKENPDATIADLPRKNRGPLSTVTKHNWMNKIAEIKQNPNLNVNSRKANRKFAYRHRLRQNELRWYNFLKFAYDFKFGKFVNKVPDSMKSLEFVRATFDVQINMPILLNMPYTVGAVQVCLEKLVRMHGEDDKFMVTDMPFIGYRLPPSYSTLLAFRGICIQVSSAKKLEESSKESPEALEAKRKFRQRLVALMYNTALLSRLTPEIIEHRNDLDLGSTEADQIGDQSMNDELKTKKIAEEGTVAKRKAKRKTAALKKPPSKRQKLESE